MESSLVQGAPQQEHACDSKRASSANTLQKGAEEARGGPHCLQEHPQIRTHAGPWISVGLNRLHRAGLKLLGSSDPPALTSQTAGITGMSLPTGSNHIFKYNRTSALTLSPGLECGGAIITHCSLNLPSPGGSFASASNCAAFLIPSEVIYSQDPPALLCGSPFLEDFLHHKISLSFKIRLCALERHWGPQDGLPRAKLQDKRKEKGHSPAFTVTSHGLNPSTHEWQDTAFETDDSKPISEK
ncbi:hypothetical protein AAY473_024887 [Plecturocebus cupreus]